MGHCRGHTADKTEIKNRAASRWIYNDYIRTWHMPNVAHEVARIFQIPFRMLQSFQHLRVSMLLFYLFCCCCTLLFVYLSVVICSFHGPLPGMVHCQRQLSLANGLIPFLLKRLYVIWLTAVFVVLSHIKHVGWRLGYTILYYVSSIVHWRYC